MKIILFILGCTISFFASAQVIADFAAAVPQKCSPVSVRFSDSSAGKPTSWTWDFGNGDTSHASNPVEIYDSAGVYNVTLTVANSSNTNTIKKQVTIIGSIDAGFTYQYDNVCAAPSHFTFAATDPRDTISYQWNFGNSNTAVGKATATTYTSTGSFPVRLITSTPQGCKDTAYQTFTIGGAKAGFSSFSVVCKNSPVTFTDTSFPKPLITNWYINGVATGVSGQTFTHTFTGNGKYAITMEAGFGSCRQNVDKTIEVKDRPVASFTTTGSLQSCTVPATVQFTNASTNADSYKWFSGDGSISSGTNLNFTYQQNGAFSPTLVAFNGDGCSDTAKRNNLIRLGPPQITSFTSLPKSGCIPVVAESDANITSPDPVVSYQWNSGDNGVLVNGSHFSHTYTIDKYFDVSLTVTTQNGCTGSFTLKQAVAAGTKPITDFTVDKANVCASTPVNFIDKSVGLVTSWNWNFGDGLSVSGKNPSHVFTKIGSNDVTLYISNKGCSGDPKTIKNIVTVLPPIADFTYSYTCTNQLAVQLTDKSVQPLSWSWDFGDGLTSISPSPLHTYAASGNYRIVLKTVNGSCSSWDTSFVSVASEKPVIVMQPSKSFICRNDSIILSAVSNSGLVTKYSWNTGDGSAVINDSTIKHAYKLSNDYKPYVAIEYANKCLDTIYTPEPLHVYGPTASFTQTQTGTCLPVAVSFTDNSATDKLHTIDSRVWVYGDGETDNITSTSHIHTYQDGGSFLPELIITDAVGCTDSVMALTPIVAKGATPSFSYASNAVCDSAVVNFTNTSFVSGDVITAYSWNFGDNSRQASSANPVHAYYRSGSYKVTLTVTTQSGCSANFDKTIDITFSPKQTVKVTGQTTGCVLSGVPLSAAVSGNNPAASWSWLLGNGTQQNGQSITANYRQPGAYNITAIAATNGGCADTGYANIIISDLPNTYAGVDNFVCAGSSIALAASGADSYTWQQVNSELSCTNCSSPFATPSAPVSYVVTGKNTAGCESNDTVMVDVQSKQFVTVASNSFAICQLQTVQLSASGTDEYSWQPSTGLSNVSAPNPMASPLVDIVYSVTGTDSRHCFTDTKPVSVSVDAAPVFNIIDSALTLPRGSVYQLSTTSSADIVRWSWLPAAGLSCSDCAQPSLTAVLSGTYTATAYTANGCSDSDKVTVFLLCDQSGIFIPNAFTPNNDGRNDRFYPKSFADSKITHFIIVSRTGEIVYERNNILTNAAKEGWDGTYKGQTLPAGGTYTYRIEVECDKTLIPFTGTVTILK